MRSGIQTSDRSLKPNPKPKLWIRKGPKRGGKRKSKRKSSQSRNSKLDDMNEVGHKTERWDVGE